MVGFSFFQCYCLQIRGLSRTSGSVLTMGKDISLSQSRKERNEYHEEMQSNLDVVLNPQGMGCSN